MKTEDYLIKKVKRLRPKPGDVLVVSVSRRLSPGDVDRLINIAKNASGCDCKTIFEEPGFEVKNVE